MDRAIAAQVIVDNGYIAIFLDIMCTTGIGFEHVENFDPFDTNNYRRALNEGEDARMITLNKFIMRGAQTYAKR